MNQRQFEEEPPKSVLDQVIGDAIAKSAAKDPDANEPVATATAAAVGMLQTFMSETHLASSEELTRANFQRGS